jgi:hypothetical protein
LFDLADLIHLEPPKYAFGSDFVSDLQQNNAR